MLVAVPIFLSDSVVNTKVEIQIRTIAMDFWASLEHSLRYKNNLENPELSEKLQGISDDIEHLENEMLAIRKEIEGLSEE